ncbi:hypothetical protein CXB49_22590 [Chromobacterium sp. ATCC 53434]|uniref:helix-turn-helix domain-containing protein n=1 Tax=Chromobacterium sp. (strain ATCC 53434 / SC 14030) TaxID=2059672 RepID=UPI000C7809CD|nr:helix-turn-helix transcriptional regulator [Chromobacterium sp. ATCC 53434]AUH53363.1 hypothetical protein CXB49_22590 [Chromobacterium sp. ATCC 53434]
MHANDEPQHSSFLNEFKSSAIRRIRDRKLTISELARLTGIKQSTLHRGLFEERELTLSNAHAISHALGLDPFGRERSADVRMAPVLTRLEQLDRLPPAGQPVWDEYVRLDHPAAADVVAVDQALFRPALFPARAVLLIQSGADDAAQLVYRHSDHLSFADGGAAIGKIIGITFRKNT